jgi:citrate/tricarballylate utilization protein
MPELDVFAEAARQLTVCNACRYCEEYCAVFPAIELRTSFERGDVLYLANLCHDCRDCYYACQYAPPHEFAVNLPQVLTQARERTYQDYAWPALLRRLGRLGPARLAVLAGGLAALFLVITWAVMGWRSLGRVRTGAGAFYRVVPWPVMLGVALVLALLVVLALTVGAVRFARARPIAQPIAQQPNAGSRTAGRARGWGRALAGAVADAASLRYLRGPDDEGCPYPGDQPSRARVVLHSLVAWGFLADLAATAAAAVEQDLLGIDPPYPLLSVPVVLGTLGGVAILAGVAGLFALERRSDRRPSSSPMRRMDVAFLLALALVAGTGLLLLVLRATAAMGVLLEVHLGTVAALFLTMPYGKFAHAVYRFAALVRYRLETAAQGRE